MLASMLELVLITTIFRTNTSANTSVNANVIANTSVNANVIANTSATTIFNANTNDHYNKIVYVIIKLILTFDKGFHNYLLQYSWACNCILGSIHDHWQLPVFAIICILI